MKSSARLFLIAAILVHVAPVAARADAITIGTGDSAFCIPFGCKDVSRYQQVYDASLFSGVFHIGELAFFRTLDRMSGWVDPAEYEVRLAITAQPVNGLNGTDFDSNISGRAQLVFAGPLAGFVPLGGTLAFPVADPFRYDPRMGNLLVDIRKLGGIFFGDDGVHMDSDLDMVGSSSVNDHPDSRFWNNRSLGLVTRFTGEVAPVPEPATVLLIGAGLAGTLARHRRRR